ncbi:hypothetical protein BS47DRAFT_1300302 [Hydnum rufescens UP504]|uniref:Uncharacterized protein n=1 Tax=Hydnum rufescens UP504 TaxID=1448309 RepID=A0A9P6AT68_9AGAM|nr:hypothetical protein BS47DRAFT_1300302 [Hydnum rufescens UP504]
MNVIECPEFRALLLYLQENLTNDDIPGRTKIRSSILKMWQTEFLKLKSELEGSLGKVSFTADIWSDSRLRPFLAITAHWIQRLDNGSLSL